MKRLASIVSSFLSATQSAVVRGHRLMSSTVQRVELHTYMAVAISRTLEQPACRGAAMKLFPFARESGPAT